MNANKILTSQLILNWLTRILFFTSLSALLPTFPLYLKELGADESQIGLVMSSFAFGVLIFRPLVGKQIDTLGRKIIILLGTLIFIVAPILYVFIKSIPLLIPARIFHGLGMAAFGTASITLITDATSIQNRGEVLSYTSVSNTVAFAVGPILGIFIRDNWGDTTLFGFVSILAFSCFLISFLLKETRPHEISKNHIGYLQAILKRRILVAFLIILLISITHGGIMFFLPIFLNDLVKVNIGVFFAIYGTAALIIRFIVGRLSDRVGRGPVIVGALLCITAGVYLLSQTTSISLMFIAAVLYGFGFGSHQPTLSALVADNTTQETRGKIFSFYFGGFDLGISIAGILLGVIAETYGMKNMIILCSGLAVTAMLIFISLAESNIIKSLQCAFSLQKRGRKCYICDQFMEVTPEQAEEYFKTE
ncbi:MAG: MFS transporter [bacterium]